MDTNVDNFSSLADSISMLMNMQNADNDQRAVELYRAMFRNEKDINKLDFNYADHILGYVEWGCKKAEVDYKNFLNYLKTIAPNEYDSHLMMFNEAIQNRNNDNFEKDEN